MPIRYVLLLIAIAFVFVPAGCSQSGPFERFDREIARVIREQQTDSLGDSKELDNQPVPPWSVDDRVDSTTFEMTPPTHNPSAKQLDAKTDAAAMTDPAVRAQVPVMREKGDNPVSMSLEQVWAYAIEYGPSYRDAKEQLFLQAIALLSERHLWGPRFFNTTEANFRGTPEPGDHAHAVDLMNTLGVTQRLPYGGEVSARALVDAVEQLRTQTGDANGSFQNASVIFDASLPLLRGAGRSSSRRERLIQQERDLVYEVRRFERFRRQFLVDIAGRYFNLIQQQARIKNTQLQVENLRALVEELEARSKANKDAPPLVQRTKQRQFDAEDSLINAIDNLESNLDNFKIDIGMPIQQQLTLLPIELDIPEPMLDFQQSAEVALKDRLDLQTIGDRVDDARRGVLVAKNETLPDLDLSAGTTLRTDSDKRRGGFDLAGADGSYRAGILFDAPLDRKIEKLALRRAQIGLEQARRDYGVERSRVVQDVRRAIRNVKQARFSLVLQEQNVQLTERRALELDIRRKSGISEVSNRDLTEVQEDLVSARNSLAQAQANLRTGVLQYLLETGQMRVDSRGQLVSPIDLTPPLSAAPPADTRQGEDSGT